MTCQDVLYCHGWSVTDMSFCNIIALVFVDAMGGSLIWTRLIRSCSEVDRPGLRSCLGWPAGTMATGPPMRTVPTFWQRSISLHCYLEGAILRRGNKRRVWCACSAETTERLRPSTCPTCSKTAMAEWCAPCWGLTHAPIAMPAETLPTPLNTALCPLVILPTSGASRPPGQPLARRGHCHELTIYMNSGYLVDYNRDQLVRRTTLCGELFGLI